MSHGTASQSDRTRHCSFVRFAASHPLLLYLLANTSRGSHKALHRTEPELSTQDAAPCSCPRQSPEADSPILEGSHSSLALNFCHTSCSKSHRHCSFDIQASGSNIQQYLSFSSVTLQLPLAQHHDIEFLTSSVSPNGAVITRKQYLRLQLMKPLLPRRRPLINGI